MIEELHDQVKGDGRHCVRQGSRHSDRRTRPRRHDRQARCLRAARPPKRKRPRSMRAGLGRATQRLTHVNDEPPFHIVDRNVVIVAHILARSYVPVRRNCSARARMASATPRPVASATDCVEEGPRREGGRGQCHSGWGGPGRVHTALGAQKLEAVSRMKAMSMNTTKMVMHQAHVVSVRYESIWKPMHCGRARASLERRNR